MASLLGLECYKSDNESGSDSEGTSSADGSGQTVDLADYTQHLKPLSETSLIANLLLDAAPAVTSTVSCGA